MYLSRVEIDYTNRKNIRELNHLGAFHNWVEQSFPEEISAKQRNRKLWRIDHLYDKDYLLIVSESKPDLTALEKYGKKTSAEVKDYDTFINNLSEGQKMKFRVVLNPVVSKNDLLYPDKRGRVFPLIKEEDQLEFLYQRADKNGFKLEKDEFYILRSGFELLRRPGNKTIKVVKAEYQGELIISDKEKFINTLKNGIGKKKAYGFGMMTVIPVQ